MSKIQINGNCYDIELFVFDKDGLMFESRHFWKELVRSRVVSFQRILQEAQVDPTHLLDEWLDLFDVTYRNENGHYTILDVSALGLVAGASVPEEIAISGGFLKERASLPWLTARELAMKIFDSSDAYFDLAQSLKPRPGFPEIFVRLREAGIPYGIATSDTYERAKKSIDLYDDFQALSFTVSPLDVKRGKPFPEMLYLIQEKTGIAVEKMLMIGDSVVDVKMAAAAGAVGLGISESDEMRARMAGYATEIVDSLNDIQILA